MNICVFQSLGQVQREDSGQQHGPDQNNPAETVDQQIPATSPSGPQIRKQGADRCSEGADSQQRAQLGARKKEAAERNGLYIHVNCSCPEMTLKVR